MGRDDARPPYRVGPRLPSVPVDAAVRRTDEAPAIARIAALIIERRQLRERTPITPISLEDKTRVATIDAELDQLWTVLRRTRSPSRHIPMPTAATAG
jgi:hypothetical protein